MKGKPLTLAQIVRRAEGHPGTRNKAKYLRWYKANKALGRKITRKASQAQMMEVNK